MKKGAYFRNGIGKQNCKNLKQIENMGEGAQNKLKTHIP